VRPEAHSAESRHPKSSKPSIVAGARLHYFKVKGETTKSQILRLDEARHDWELTIFRASGAGFSAIHHEGQKRGKRMS